MRAGGDRGARAEPEAVAGPDRGVEDDAAPVREHVVELDMVRARLRGGEKEGEERG